MRPSGVAVTVEAIARASAEESFDAIVQIALPRMFIGYGPLPAVSATREQSGDWNHVGVTRVVDLADGSSARAQITHHERPRYFAYTVSGFTSSLRALVHGARSEWWFSSAIDGRTEIRWRYTFEPRRLTRPIVTLAVVRLWRRYARKALALAVREAEQPGSWTDPAG